MDAKINAICNSLLKLHLSFDSLKVNRKNQLVVEKILSTLELMLGLKTIEQLASELIEIEKCFKKLDVPQTLLITSIQVELDIIRNLM